MATSEIDGLYWESHWPLSLKQLLDQAAAERREPTTVVQPPSERQWLSQPRPSTDDTTEVVQINFKLPLSVSELAFEALRVPVRIEVWYQDRLNNWRQVLDHNRMPVALTLTNSSAASWYKYKAILYPIVAKAVQLRLTRVPDPTLGNRSYVVGIRNTLLRRNVYDRNAGRLPFEEELDPVGNIVASYVKDWDACRAIDDRPHTFWRSAPQPDHQAVVALHLDVRRQSDGAPQTIDHLYIDPVYHGQTLNIYYSNDDSVGTRKLSPITLPPDVDVNTEWRAGRGRWDTSSGPSATSSYTFPFRLGPLVRQDVWVGIEWIPDFDPLDGPPNNPVLLGVTPTDPAEGQWWPSIRYDVGSGEIVLTFADTEGRTKTFSAAISPILKPGEPLRIVVGWRYDPKRVLISVRDRTGAEVAHLEDTSPDLPEYVSLDGQMGFQNFRGTLTSHVVKLEGYDGYEAFQANPSVYVSPELLVPDATGELPSTTLDNAVYACDWTLQTHGSGGPDETLYANKVWTPIWRDYLTYRGKLYFPRPVSAKYLKLEFTNLTEEPYPVYDSGVQVTYEVFPVQIQQMASTVHPGILGTVGGAIQLGAETVAGAFGLTGVNWLNPSSVSRAIDRIFGTTIEPITVTTGAPISYSQLPASVGSDIVDTVRTEKSNAYIYRRDALDPTRMAGYTILDWLHDWGATISHSLASTFGALGDSFVPLINWVQQPVALPIQGLDWWIFPGATMIIPAAIMNGLTALTQVVLGRKRTTEVRMRFTTTSVHRYERKTVVRDAAIAYFAGVREVRALSTAHIDYQDPPLFDFGTYNPDHWVLQHTRALDSGPITTTRRVYEILNPGFDLSLANWFVPEGHPWERDGAMGRWHWGSLTIAHDGEEHYVLSAPFDVEPGDEIEFSCWVRWRDLVAADGEAAIALAVTAYGESGELATDVVADVTYPDWSAVPYSHTPPDDEEEEGDPPAEDWIKLTGTWVVPEGATRARVRPVVTGHASAGRVWFDTFRAEPAVEVLASAYKEIITTSSFAKLRCDFRDSGLVRSDAMWARIDPLATGIDNLQLAYYVSTIPEGAPSGTWGDTLGTWGDQRVTWGSPRSQVSITVDPNRVFDGRRALKFRRAPGAGEAGMRIVQTTNMISGAVARLCAVFYRPLRNSNEILLRLRRMSDGVYVHEEIIPSPPVGYWHTHQGQFFELPEGEQAYWIELTTSGDAEDELYVSDLYTEVAHIRYFMRLGGADQPLHEVTELRYADSAQITATTPVNECVVQLAILSPQAYAYGCTIMPSYLK